MTLKPGSAALVMVLALLTAMGPLSTDMYLPSLPAIASAFATDAGQVQLSQMTFAALVGVMAGHLVEHTPDALAWTIAVLGLTNLALTLAARGRVAGTVGR